MPSLLSLITPIDDNAVFFPDLVHLMASAGISGEECEWLIVHDGVRTPDSMTGGFPLPDYAIWIKGDGHSATSAVNIGIAAAKAPYLHFLMGDDLPVISKLLDLARMALDVTQPPEIVSGGVRFFGDGISESEGRRLHYPNFDWQSALFDPTYLDGRLFHRDLIDRIGTFENRFSACSDRDYMIRALQQGATHSRPSNDCIYRYRIHSQSGSMGGNPTLITNAIFMHLDIAEIARQRCSPDDPAIKLLRTWESHEVLRLLFYGTRAGRVASVSRRALTQFRKDPIWVFRALSAYLAKQS